MNYIVTEREVLITRYLVTGADDEEDAADCVRSGMENVEVLDKAIEPLTIGEDDWGFEEAPE